MHVKSIKLIKPVLFLLLILNFVIACTESPTNNRQKAATTGVIPTNYIVHCPNKCDRVASEIRSIGGRVLQRYQNFDIIAFELSDPTATNKNILAQYAIVKDKQIKMPTPIDNHSIAMPQQLNLSNNFNSSNTDLSTLSLKSYASNNVKTGAAQAHSNNILGQGVVVAIIDSGTANNSQVVPLIAGNVIGGENFTHDDLDVSATSTLNAPHGTEVGTMIAAHGSVTIPKTHPLAIAITKHSPENIVSSDADNIVVPVMGTAPAASLYALKIFSSTGGGASDSTVIAAMDRAITLKKNFNNGMPSEPVAGDGSEENPFVYDSLNIQVVNMSLGGPSLFPGYAMDDILTTAMLDAGIVIVVSAGNEGFAAITGGSPGTGIGALSVGASNDYIHERIYRDVSIGDGFGVRFRPTQHPQIADFSSRGPTADGRDGIDIVANGRSVFVQGADGEMALVSGTSFSAPTVAGAAALLWSKSPKVDALEVKLALIEGAKDDFFLPGTTRFDQGHGFLAVDKSLALLDEDDDSSDDDESHLPTKPLAELNSKVSENIDNVGVPIFSLEDDKYSQEITLVPGQVHQIFVETDEDTHDITIEIDDFKAELPIDKQNVLFGDEFILIAADAQLSIDHIVLSEFILESQTFTISHIQPGLVRVALLGDWTNVGKVSAEIKVSRGMEKAPESILEGMIADGETLVYELTVDPTVSWINFGLSWKNNWAFYPTYDLDFFVVDPEGFAYFNGATFHSPERVAIDLPTPGVWTIYIDGFLLHGFNEEFEFFARDQNGKMLSINQ